MWFFIGYIVLIILFLTFLLEIRHTYSSPVVKMLKYPLLSGLGMNFAMLGIVYVSAYLKQGIFSQHVIFDFISAPLNIVYIGWVIFDIGILCGSLGLVYISLHYPKDIVSGRRDWWIRNALKWIALAMSTAFIFRNMVEGGDYFFAFMSKDVISSWLPYFYTVLLGSAFLSFLYQILTSWSQLTRIIRMELVGLAATFVLGLAVPSLFIFSLGDPEMLLLFIPLCTVIWIPVVLLFLHNYALVVNIKRISIYLGLITSLMLIFLILIQNHHLVSFIFDFVIILIIVPIIIFIITFLQKEESYLIAQRKANQELTEIIQVKDTFIHMTAHQIRSPLLVLEEYLRKLLEGETFPLIQGEIRSDIIRMYSNVERLKTTVNDVGLANNISEDHNVFHAKQNLDLVKIITYIINDRKELSNESDIMVIFNYNEEHSYYVEGDPIWLQEAFSKVIDNALLFASSQVNITLEHDKKYICFCVSDDGIGVTEEEQEHIFTRFYRSQRALQVHPDGSGLGLYLAQYIIYMHQGSIEIRSQGKDQGTHCQIFLPQIK